MNKLHGELTQMAWPKYFTDPTDSILSVLTTEELFQLHTHDQAKIFKQHSKCTIKI